MEQNKPTSQTSNTAMPGHSTATPNRGVQISDEIKSEILRLHAHYGTRQIARRMGCSRKLVRRLLQQGGMMRPHSPAPQPPGKLDPFCQRITDLVEKGLTASRILRELRSLGYSGGRTILADHIRQVRATMPLDSGRKKVKRRFETPPSEEMQVDWSLYRASIAGRMVKLHALGCLLCHSRKLYLRFYRDERQSTLLEGLASAFEYFEGCSLRLVLDNMATAVLGRIGPDRKPLWHERFLQFARHYGFEPFACAVADPDRKGKDEKVFRLVWDDLLKGSQFASWEDLDEQRRIWLDETPQAGNLRIHGTTRLVPNEVWQYERQFLIRLPQQRFPVHEEAVRIVDQDATLSILATRYSVPAALAGRSVAVRLYAEHFEVLDPHGRIALSRRYVADAEKGRLVIDPTHYATLPRRPRDVTSTQRLDEAFLRRFPALEPLVAGLKLRLKSLAPIHLRALLRLAERYGEEAFMAAANRAQQYRRFDALAVQRILERDHPLPEPDGDLLAPLGGIGPLLLGEVDGGCLDGYSRLDNEAPSGSQNDTVDK